MPDLGTLSSTGRGLSSCHLVAEVLGGVDSTLPAYTLEVDWTNSGVWVNETAYLRGATVSRGRSQVNDAFGAGQCTLRLRNLEGRFSPFWTGSPNYPNVIGGRPLRLTASFRGTSYRLFTGFTGDFDQTTAAPAAETSITAFDAFNRFRMASAFAAPQTGPRTDQVISAILAAAGWTGSTMLDIGQTLPVYAQVASNVLQALQHAALQDCAGLLFMGRDGSVVFQGRLNRANQPIWQAFTQTDGIQVGLRQNDLVDVIHATFATQTLGSTLATTSAYSGLSGAALPPGSTTLTDSFGPPAVQAVLWPLAITDYTANDDSSDMLDVTANVYVTAFSNTQNTFSVTFQNLLPYTVYLKSFGIRGTTLVVSVSGQPITLTGLNGSVPTQTLSQTFDFVADRSAVNTWVQQRGAAMRVVRPRPVITVKGTSPWRIHALLGAELGNRVLLIDQGQYPQGAGVYDGGLYDVALYDAGPLGPWLSQLTQQFFIEQIQVQITAGQPPSAQWTLYDAPMAGVI